MFELFCSALPVTTAVSPNTRTFTSERVSNSRPPRPDLRSDRCWALVSTPVAPRQVQSSASMSLKPLCPCRCLPSPIRFRDLRTFAECWPHWLLILAVYLPPGTGRGGGLSSARRYCVRWRFGRQLHSSSCPHRARVVARLVGRCDLLHCCELSSRRQAIYRYPIGFALFAFGTSEH
jgi:hypothetical protein